MEPQNKAASGKKSIDFKSKAAQQQDVVKKLSEESKKNPSADLQQKLVWETDLLRHYAAASKSDPKGRAKKAAGTAKRATLNKAVRQV